MPAYLIYRFFSSLVVTYNKPIMLNFCLNCDNFRKIYNWENFSSFSSLFIFIYLFVYFFKAKHTPHLNPITNKALPVLYREPTWQEKIFNILFQYALYHSDQVGIFQFSK